MKSLDVPGTCPECKAHPFDALMRITNKGTDTRARAWVEIVCGDCDHVCSALGLSQITLQFNLSRDMDGAALDVQAAIAAASKQLPPQMTTPPTFSKVNPANQPVLYLALSSPTLPLYKVDDYAYTILAQRLSTVEGVSQVVRVEHGSCANAVGAAIAQVSGEVDQVYQGLDRAEAISRARARARPSRSPSSAPPSPPTIRSSRARSMWRATSPSASAPSGASATWPATMR